MTRIDAEAMGNAKDIISEQYDDKYFTKMDLIKLFWQMLMEKSSNHLTEFSTADGWYILFKNPFLL